MAGPHVAWAKELRVRRHGEREHAVRTQYSANLFQRVPIVLDVLQHLAQHGGVETLVLEGKRGQVGFYCPPRAALTEELDCGRRHISARDLEPKLHELPRERALAGASVQDGGARTGGEEKVEEETLAEVVARADELGRRPPLVAHVR
jgi:hypothetical protein